MPADALAARRAILASRRFARERRSFAAKYPSFDAALRDFVRFRVSAANGEPYDAKDGRVTAAATGLRRWHAVHGKALVLYDLPPGRLVLLAVVEHAALDRPAALSALHAQFAALAPDDLAPVPLLLADAEVEAAFHAQAAEIARLRSALAREQAEIRTARADADAAWELAQAEQAAREAADTVVPYAPVVVPAEGFGSWLRRVRLERGMTQAEVADLAGVTRVTVNQYERGVRPPSPGYRARIEAVLAEG